MLWIYESVIEFRRSSPGSLVANTGNEAQDRRGGGRRRITFPMPHPSSIFPLPSGSHPLPKADRDAFLLICVEWRSRLSSHISKRKRFRRFTVWNDNRTTTQSGSDCESGQQFFPKGYASCEIYIRPALLNEGLPVETGDRFINLHQQVVGTEWRP